MWLVSPQQLAQEEAEHAFIKFYKMERVSRIMAWPWPSIWKGVEGIPEKVEPQNLPGVDVVLQGKFQLGGSNGLAGYRL